MMQVFNPRASDLFVSFFFVHLKLELLTQFPASNDEKYIYVGIISI